MSVHTNVMIKANTRGALLKYLKAVSEALNDGKIAPKDRTLLYMNSASCGCTRKYKTLKNIPKNSVKCSHGTYFIKYLS